MKAVTANPKVIRLCYQGDGAGNQMTHAAG